MASSFRHVAGVAKQVRLERIVRWLPIHAAEGCETYLGAHCRLINAHLRNWDNLHFTIWMTNALGIALFNGNWIEPLANLYSAS